MNVSCPECRSVFRVDPAKVPVAGVQARCSVCGGVIAVAAASVAAVRGSPAAPLDAAEDASVEVVEQAKRGNAVFVAPPSEHEMAAEMSDAFAAALGAPAATMPSRASAQPEEAPRRGAIEPASAAPPVTSPSDTRRVDALPLSGPPGEPSPAGVPRLARPVNPYLNNTPELRARRLARALVSDLVAYNPQKREEGLRDGTLRQLFRDEIRKSWDEYVEQVGAHVAESTPHFQDALNDVLAGGRRVF